MSTTTGAEPAGHPIVSFGVRANNVLDGLAGVPAWSMNQGEMRTSLVDLARVTARVEELRLRVLAAGDRADIGAASAASSTGAWLADATAVPVKEAHRDVRLARALDDGYAATRDALAAGAVNVEQAREVIAAVQGLPGTLVTADPSLVERAEKHMLTLAEGTDSPSDSDRSGDTDKPGDSDDTGTDDTAGSDSDTTTDTDTDSDSDSDSDGHADGGSGGDAGDGNGCGRHPGLDAFRLKQVGRHLCAVLDPDAADELLGRRLEDDEAAAARKTFLAMWDNGDGTHSGRFKVSDVHAAMIRKALEAIIAPRQRHKATTKPDQATGQDTASGPGQATEPEAATGQAAAGGQDQASQRDDQASDPASHQPCHEFGNQAGDQSDGRGGDPPDTAADERVAKAKLSRPELMGEAFCRLLERITGKHLPMAGGMSATVVVLLDFDKLLTGLGTATLDTGEVISAAMARRMACESGVIPVVYRDVLGGRPVVLDVGRKRRFHSEAQRVAMVVRDGGCTADGCDRPPAWTETHHPAQWVADHGVTSVENGQLLCAFHHHKAHSPGYDLQHLPNGKVRFHKRT